MTAQNQIAQGRTPDLRGLPHLAGPAATLRQAMAAHFVTDFAHIVELGGHESPITGFLTHHPSSVLSVDPKTPAMACDELNGRPCKVRHVACKFQAYPFDLTAGSYALVMVGYSLKPFGARDPVGDKLVGLMRNSGRTVLEYSPNLERASAQVEPLLARSALRRVCSVEFELSDESFVNSAYARRRLLVLEPAGRAAPAGAA